MYINSRQRDKLFSITIICFSVLVGLVLYSYPIESSYFPRFITFFLLIMGIILFIRSCISSENKATDEIDKNEQLKTVKIGGLIFISLILYIIAIKNIDYSISTIVFLSVMMYILGFKNLMLNIVISVSFYAALYLMFFYFLGISTP